VKALSNEQKMKRFIWRIIATVTVFAICGVSFYIVRFLPDEGRHVSWIQAAALEALPLIFLGGAFMGFQLLGIVRILLARVSECRERIELLENQIFTLKGQGAESS
jgi:hypothetical protein